MKCRMMRHFINAFNVCHTKFDGKVIKFNLETITDTYDASVASGNDITPCNKFDRPLVVDRFSETTMTPITTVCT